MFSLSHSNSLTRIRSFQRLLGSIQIDALLCIPGPDSNYNEGSRRLFNYLLYEVSGDELEQLELGATEEEEEDTFLLITPTQLCVYCHPNFYNSLTSQLGRWHSSLSVWCDLSYSDREDTDHFEVFKIKSFIEMTGGIKHIGVPYGSGSSATAGAGEKGFSKMSVEQWPLIQAYALEEMGGCGFFTMTHLISDVSRDVEKVYSEVDPLSARYLHKGQRLFSKQWEHLIESISRREPRELGEISEMELVTGMKAYIQHAKRLEPTPGRSKGYVYALIGQNSQKLKYKPCPVASNSATIDSEEGAVRHGVAELSDPLLPLACARTLFFSQTHSPLHPDPALSSPRAPNPDHEYLVHLYQLLVTEVRNGMQSVVTAANLGDVKESVFANIRTALNKESEDGDREIGIHIHALAYNVFKEERSMECEIDGKSVYYLKATLTDILSPMNPARKLGAIVFGDSFLISKLRVESCGSQLITETNNLVTVLTESIPVFLSWADRCSQLLGNMTLKSCLQSGGENQLGNPISLGAKDISLATDFIPGFMPHVQTYFLSRGLVLQNRAWKLVWVPWDHVERICLVERTDSSEDKRLQISLKSSLISHLPVFFRSRIFSLLYSPHSTEHSKLYTEVVRYLKSVRPNFFSIETETLGVEEKNVLESGFHTFEKFNDLNQITHIYGGSISSHSLSSYLYPGTTSSGVGRLVVNVLVGLPGSNVEMLAGLIVALTRGEFDWMVLCEQLEFDCGFNPERFRESFQDVVQICLNKREDPSKSESELRILVLAPSFSTPSQVVQAILQHTSAAVKENTCVGCVTLCLDPASSFRKSGELHPLTCHSLRPGVVSNIVLSGAAPQGQVEQTLQYTQLLALCCGVAVGVRIIQTPHISALPTEHVRSILSQDNFHNLGRIRTWYNPDLEREAPIEPPMHIESRAVKCRYFLSQKSLNAALKTLPKDVEFVKGVVKLSSDTPQYHHVEMNHSAVSVYPGTSSPSHPPNTSVILFYGRNLQHLDFLAVMQSSLPIEKQKLCLKTEESLSKDEMTEIDLSCKSTPLPEGVYFNGYQYVGFDGERWFCHPCRQDIVSEYLVAVNKKVEFHNKDLDKFYEDIFSY